MRGTRWLLLVAIAAILGGVAFTYRAQRKTLQDQAPPKPKALPTNLDASAKDWDYKTYRDGLVASDMSAKDYQLVKDPPRVDLQQVKLKIYSKDHTTYDLVTSAAASFFPSEQRLYSDGAVQITLGVPVTGQPKHTLVSIQSSGVSVDRNTGKAETDRPASFVFENGDGNAVGAFYDPTTHELQMKSQVQLNWKTQGPNSKPMKIEAANLSYHEDIQEIWLKPWGKLTRENTVVEGQNDVVHLQDGVIQRIEANQATGTDTYPDRKLQYSANELYVEFSDEGEVEKITGQTNARLVSTSTTSETTVTADHVEMYFQAKDNESLLTQVVANGHGTVDSKPLAAPGRPLPDTHVLRGDALELKMQPGGRDLASVVTHGPGTLEFLPNVPASHHRILDGKDLQIAYGPQNRMQSFHATDAKTHTFPTVEERKRNRVESITTGQEMNATFEPGSSRIASIEQNGNFTYDEGPRKARSAKATMDAVHNVMVLDTGARMWDETGSTTADRIRMDQRTGDFTAEGNVNSSRLPDSGPRRSSEMLSGDEPLQAQAQKMESSDRNRQIHYEGNVVMWQGADRIQADDVEINRAKHTLVASGNVVTQLWDDSAANQKPGAAASKTGTPNAAKPKAAELKAAAVPAKPVLTVVHAPHLVYTEADRLAIYTGGVHLERPGMDVKSQQLRAYLSQPGGDSRVEKAFADGGVVIVQTAPDRTRTGTSEHAEYYVRDQKVVLTGGVPRLIDSVEGTTQGANGLTYFANDDRLLVNGAPGQPATSRIRRK
ncbi:MAG TPA: LPS export ABC transporter periplasmic protein LptC [Bryobacteraceae bacterium]|nr:LPS export ABC transporter periplasmic protein LptC [Bryobacteraceae bacterium]